jgi:dolichyl-diphosphooligosaccharide--protein glycosyltransferase
MMMAALTLAGIIFLASAGSAWSEFTWLSLGGSLAACLLAGALGELWRRRQWRGVFLLPVACVGLLAALGIMALIEPATFRALAATITRYMPNIARPGGVNTVAELTPLWKVPPGGFAALFENLGGVWIVAFPFLLYTLVKVWRARRPALVLFAVWSLVMTAGGFIQVRMLVYLGVLVAISAGAGAVRLIDWLDVKRRSHATAVAGFVIFIFATSAPAVRQAGWNGGLSPDWLSALTWLSRNTPEPMGDSQAWTRQWPAPDHGPFAYPASAYGVLTWWEFGDQVSFFAHRIPNTNGTQAQAGKVALFLTETDPDQARSELMQLGTRYVVLDPVFLRSTWPAIVIWADGDDARYRKHVFAVGAGGRGTPITVFLQDFYRSMASRLYLFDGQTTASRFRITVFTTRRERASSGKDYDVLIARRDFPSEQKAFEYMAANTGEAMVLGSTDPTVSCVELESLPWAKRVFTSDETPLTGDRLPSAVKVFEIGP